MTPSDGCLPFSPNISAIDSDGGRLRLAAAPPRSCWVSAWHCASPVAPSARPLDSSPPGRIGDVLAAMGVGVVADIPLGAAFGAEAQGLLADQFVGRATVVQLDHIDVIRTAARGLMDLARGLTGHVETTPFIINRSSKK